MLRQKRQSLSHPQPGPVEGHDQRPISNSACAAAASRGNKRSNLLGGENLRGESSTLVRGCATLPVHRKGGRRSLATSAVEQRGAGRSRTGQNVSGTAIRSLG
jgi:hypothetical protein